jgi:hypothetical protein
MTDVSEQDQPRRQQLEGDLTIEDLDVTPEESAELVGGDGPRDAATGQASGKRQY